MIKEDNVDLPEEVVQPLKSVRTKVNRATADVLTGIEPTVASTREKAPPSVKNFTVVGETEPGAPNKELKVQGGWELVTLGILLSIFDPVAGELDTQVELKKRGKILDIVLLKEGISIEVHAIFWDWFREFKETGSKENLPSNEELKQRYIDTRNKALEESDQPFTDILFAFNPREIIELLLTHKLFKECLNPNIPKTRLVRRFISTAAKLNRSGTTTFSMEELKELMRKSQLIV